MHCRMGGRGGKGGPKGLRLSTRKRGSAVSPSACRGPGAGLSVGAGIHLNVLNSSYDRVYLEHVQWRWALNGRLARG
jgi:hypothetical protein